jgi:hypothetical protein
LSCSKIAICFGKLPEIIDFGLFLQSQNSTVGINPRDQGLQNWTVGTWNIIKLIGINSRFTLIHKKSQEQKWLKKLNNFEKFERKKKSNFSPDLNPETS